MVCRAVLMLLLLAMMHVELRGGEEERAVKDELEEDWPILLLLRQNAASSGRARAAKEHESRSGEARRGDIVMEEPRVWGEEIVPNEERTRHGQWTRAGYAMLQNKLDERKGDGNVKVAKMFRDAMKLKENGRWDEAIDLLQTCQAEEAGEEEYISCALGMIFSERGRNEEAMAALKKSLAIEPDCPVLHYNYGIALKDTDLNEAIKQLEISAKLNPSPEAFGALCSAKMEKDPKVKLNPRLASSWLAIAEVKAELQVTSSRGGGGERRGGSEKELSKAVKVELWKLSNQLPLHYFPELEASPWLEEEKFAWRERLLLSYRSMKEEVLSRLRRNTKESFLHQIYSSIPNFRTCRRRSIDRFLRAVGSV
ncbi:hypothetical protein GUITHDRAFT_147935 [Guillardia theta CCMP2712]|uniref:Uncharacterized protein n=1 Tax=Guillardia theta (strain CCMP2712) TaxID=905079 RepID=L1IAW5_GUITC|nr:hypothetical protein GUITHDRAFT_147935 [Guillardia theta CCMP2712]EKX33391.1 hypothetical protein GUITHDRAFT_147935 [Guillardia theta CCMP2712]|eukprot:XP_005820371.1 hypothetical protein GUITHDRAFT_147935 [Guillardia theta CCMP2712]